LLTVVGFAQTTDYDLAEYYYNNGEYEQAKLYYERIYKTDKSNRVYNSYLETLVALGDLETAEKMVKKKIKSAKSIWENFIRNLTNLMMPILSSKRDLKN
jgi:tetratricopeptide (TPR) repeat protein